MNKYFFKEMEKIAIGPMGAIMGALTIHGTVSDIKTNKQNLKLATPGSSEITKSQDPYAHQFSTTTINTPNRSLFG